MCDASGDVSLASSQVIAAINRLNFQILAHKGSHYPAKINARQLNYAKWDVSLYLSYNISRMHAHIVAASYLIVIYIRRNSGLVSAIEERYLKQIS